MNIHAKTTVRLLALTLITTLLFSLLSCRAPVDVPSTDNATDTKEQGSSDSPINTQGASGILSVEINEHGELVVTYTDGSQENLGRVVGKDGENGKDGKDGIDGTDGKNVINGVYGTNGKNGMEQIPRETSIILRL